MHLTAAGRAERVRLGERSDDLARSFLAPLSERQAAQLVDAMATVERLLTAGIVELSAEDPASEAARACLRRYFAEIDERFEAGFSENVALPFDSGVFIVARLRGEPIGCGALKTATPPEIKRMWVAPEARGLGVGRRILAELERHAVAQGAVGDPAGDQPRARRGAAALPLLRLRRGRAVQRRALRALLVHEDVEAGHLDEPEPGVEPRGGVVVGVQVGERRRRARTHARSARR